MSKDEYIDFAKLSYAAAECQQYEKRLPEKADKKLKALAEKASAMSGKKAKSNATIHHGGQYVYLVKGFPLHPAFELTGKAVNNYLG